jgi:hypothetical protein
MTYKPIEIPFDSFEQERMNKDLVGNIIGFLIVLAIQSFLVYLLFTSIPKEIKVFVLIPIAILTYYVYLLGIIPLADYFCGVKLVVSGKLTKKYFKIKSGGSSSTGGGSYAGGKMMSSSSSISGADKILYYAEIEGFKVQIDQYRYDTWLVGDRVEIVVSKYSKCYF